MEREMGKPITIDLDGKTIKIKPIDLNTMAEFRQGVKAQRIKLIMDTVSDEKLQLQLIGNIVKEKIGDSELQSIATSSEGMIPILKSSLRENDLTDDEITAIVTKHYEQLLLLVAGVYEEDNPKKKKEKS